MSKNTRQEVSIYPAQGYRNKVFLFRCLIIALSSSLFVGLPPASSWAAFKVYLSNGKVIKGADKVTKESGKVRIYDDGVTIELDENNIVRIEEYENGEKTGVEGAAQEAPKAAEPHNAPAPVDIKPGEAGQEKEKERQQLMERYRSVIRKLGRIDELKTKSKELEGEIHRALRKLLPREAREVRKEKAEVDSELESLNKEKDSLLKEKEELEGILNIRTNNGINTGDKGMQENPETRDASSYGPETAMEEILLKRETLQNPQLQDLRELEGKGALPGQFKPYKDFLEKQQPQ